MKAIEKGMIVMVMALISTMSMAQNQEQKDNNKQDEKKESKEDDKNQKREEEKKKEGQNPKMSKEDAERLLNALNNKEKDLHDKLKKKQAQGVQVQIEKDW